MRVRVILDAPEPRYRRRVRSSRWVDGVRAALLLMGVAALSFCAYIYADAKIYDAYESWSLDREARGLNRNVMAFLGDVTPLRYVLPESDKPDANAAPSQSAANSRPEQTEHRKSVAPRELIGRIIIPRLGVRGIVKEGVDDRTLRRAVGHVPGTALPGESGNVGLAAHRDTFFRGLDRLEPGDRIRLTTLEGSFDYVVDSTQVVEPSATEVLQNTGEPVLTLVTCFPFRYVGRAPMRYIVRARRSGETGSRESHTRPERPAARGSLQAPAGANPTLPAGSRGSGSEAPPPLRGGRSRGVWLPDPLNPRPDPSA